LVLSADGIDKPVTATGSGPVDATFRAIEAVANSGTTLELYSVNAITSGTDSQGEVTVRLNQAGRIINGHGADTDIVIASAKAYLNALNLMRSSSGTREHPQDVTGV
jgi:2-isopropylmalate synthase